MIRLSGELMAKPENMHICLFGNERSIHIRRWALALRDAGHRVDLITLIKDPRYDIGAINLNARFKPGYLSKIFALREEVQRINPQIFHSHFASSFGFLASFVNHSRKIVSVWGDDIIEFPGRNFVNRAIIKRSLRGARRLTATSHYLKDGALKLIRPKSEIAVIPFGIDLDYFRPFERGPQANTRIGIIKWLLPKYGIDILIRAFALVIKAGHKAELAIAGRGDYEAEYKRLTIELGLSDKATFCGYIDHDRVPDFLGTLDIFAMPSTSDGESFGVAALEASATALPVVATRVGGVPEVVMDGVTGILVERSNVTQLAEALIKLIENPELRLRMGRAGRIYVEQKYRWQDNVAAMINLYREML
jgi:glycosyltransferase involved in cell wall biosynthesis